MSNEIVRYKTDSGEIVLTPEVVKKYLVSGKSDKVTDQEVMMFLNICKYQRLNPFIREAYLVKYQDNQPASIITGKDTFMKRAARNPNFDGLEAGVIVRKGNETTYRKGTLVLDDEELVGGWAKVYRKDLKVPFEVTVSLREYMKRLPDGRPMANWSSMPATMIRKVAVVQCLREAFPEDFSQLYTAEEMPAVDETSLDEAPIEVPYEIREIIEEEEAEVPEETVPEEPTIITASAKINPLQAQVKHEESPKPVKASSKAKIPKGDTRQASAKQVNYIVSLAKQVHGNYYQDYIDEFLDGFNKNSLNELTMQEASSIIETLKMRMGVASTEPQASIPTATQSTSEIIKEVNAALGDEDSDDIPF